MMFQNYSLSTSISTLILCLMFSSIQAETDLKLWYDRPAEDWMRQALPIGNGYMGAMFFGGIEEEHIQYAEGSLWSGGPDTHPDYNYGNREGAYKYLPEVRRLIAEGKLKEADELVRREMTGQAAHKHQDDSTEYGDYGAQQPMGDLFVAVDHRGAAVQNYRRELDLTTATGSVRYQAGSVMHNRSYFANYPKGVLVYCFQADQPTDYRIKHTSDQRVLDSQFNGSVLTFNGEVPNNKMGFQTAFQIVTDGKLRYENGELEVENATELLIVHTAATAYQMQYPNYSGHDFRKTVRQRLEGVKNQSFGMLLQNHLEDYEKLFERVEFNLSGPDRSDLPTDKRKQAYFEGGKDAGLEVLFFQYGRYLTIAGSRPGTMPMHLQGKWNNQVNPPWAADYHFNINIQMIYWPAELTNLSECHEPLLDYIASLVEPGRVSTKDFFNVNGWMVNTMNNAFGYTAINWDVPWGFFPGGAAWLCRHLWEHYAFTKDIEYLKKVYPVMQEASVFWMEYLTEDEKGRLVSSPSYSPEHGGISGGASMDHQLAWDVLNNSALAARLLGDDEFASKAEAVRERILAPQIGRWGQLQEWKEDVDDPDNKHRHVSHLYALHPGEQISVEQTPELAEAARVSLEARGDEATGWSLGWKVNFWARLHDGDRALKLYKMILKPAGAKKGNGGETTYSGDGAGSYDNLLDAHPPFQLDGNMGATAGVAEMLLQSQAGVLELLPALPDEWKEGEMKGLKARGNVTVDLAWKEGGLSEAKFTSPVDQTIEISYGKSRKSISLEADNPYFLRF